MLEPIGAEFVQKKSAADGLLAPDFFSGMRRRSSVSDSGIDDLTDVGCGVFPPGVPLNTGVDSPFALKCVCEWENDQLDIATFSYRFGEGV